MLLAAFVCCLHIVFLFHFRSLLFVVFGVTNKLRWIGSKCFTVT